MLTTRLHMLHVVVTQKCQNLPKYLSNRANIFFVFMEEFYLISIAIVVTQNIFLSYTKIDLKIADRLDLFPETVYYI